MATLRIVAGMFVFGMAILIVLIPDSAPPLPASVFVFVIGLTLALTGLSVAVMRVNKDQSHPDIAVVESPAARPHPGSEVDEQLEALAAGPPSPGARKHWVEARERFRARLRILAAATLADHHGLSDAESNAALDTGVWTTNPHAAAFFAGGYQDTPPFWTRLKEGFAFSSPVDGPQAEDAIDELRAIVWTDGERHPGREEIVDALEVSGGPSLPTEGRPAGNVDDERGEESTATDHSVSMATGVADRQEGERT